MGRSFIIDTIAKQAVQTVSELLLIPGEIRIGHSDIKTIMGQQGPVLIFTGSGAGKDRVLKACYDALMNPWKEKAVRAATKVLVHIAGPSGLLLKEVNDALDMIELVFPSAEVVFGVTRDINLNDKAKVTLLAALSEDGNA